MSEPSLVPFGEGLWIASAEHSFLGLHLGARMTIVRLRSGALLVHSPVALTAALKSEIESLGTVAHIVAPSLFHHMYAGEHQRAWPDAMLHAPVGLDTKRPELRIDARLGEAAHADWSGTLEPITIAGCDLRETVLFHAATRTIVSADLTENFSSMDHAPTRLYLKAAGIWQRPGWSRFLRVVYRDRRAARRSIDMILERDFDRVILAHGDVIARGGKDVVRGTFEFLR